MGSVIVTNHYVLGGGKVTRELEKESTTSKGGRGTAVGNQSGDGIRDGVGALVTGVPLRPGLRLRLGLTRLDAERLLDLIDDLSLLLLDPILH